MVHIWFERNHATGRDEFAGVRTPRYEVHVVVSPPERLGSLFDALVVRGELAISQLRSRERATERR